MLGWGNIGPPDLLSVSGPHRVSLAALVLPIDEEGRLRWTSGFSGSNGQVGGGRSGWRGGRSRWRRREEEQVEIREEQVEVLSQAVLTMGEALLWTDGRYFLQAEQQLDCQWTLMKMVGRRERGGGQGRRTPV